MQNKRGFTLIEVIVALGILSIALIGAVSLVIFALRLIETSRSVTQANALVQKGLSDNIALANCGCGSGTPDWYYDTVGSNHDPYERNINGVDFTLTVIPKDDFTALGEPDGITKEGFWQITSTVSWTVQGGGTQNVSATEYVRKPL